MATKKVQKKKRTPARKAQKKGLWHSTVSFFSYLWTKVTTRSKNKKYPSLVWIGLLIICLASLFIYRLYELQIVNGAQYRERIDAQYSREERGKSIRRGDIFFNTKDEVQILAATLRPLYTVALEPNRIINPEELYSELNEILPTDKDEYDSKVAKKDDPYEEIALRVPKETVEELKAIEHDGLAFVLQNERYYPSGDLASPVLGFMSFTDDDFSGSYGLEKYYDSILKRDRSIRTVNIFAALFSPETVTDNSTDIRKNIAKEGSLVLTIEPTVQAFLETKLDEIVERWSSKYAAGVIMDPRTGKVIAMGTSDNFDLNTDTRHYRNYLIEDRLELGSILKPLTIAIGLETNAITTDFSYNDTGTMTLNRFPISNFDGRGRGPYTDLQTILTNSLNTGVATIALEVGSEQFVDYIYKLGFAEETGIDLPNEVYGLVSNLDSKRDVEIATASFGQGIAVTPLEALRALSSVANGGYMITPYLVDSIEYGDLIPSKNISQARPEQVFSEETAKQVRSYMVNIVDNSATFSPYANPNYGVGIKTGTAQIVKPTGGYYDDRFLHSFVGFFPSEPTEEQQQYIILLYTIEPQGVRFSSTTLKDPFFSIVDFMINYFDIKPDRFNDTNAPLEL